MSLQTLSRGIEAVVNGVVVVDPAAMALSIISTQKVSLESRIYPTYDSHDRYQNRNECDMLSRLPSHITTVFELGFPFHFACQSHPVIVNVWKKKPSVGSLTIPTMNRVYLRI